MKKYLLVIAVLALFIVIGSCTNDEGGSDLDVITPNDTTEALFPNG